jgi:hypothetical protein
MILQVYYDLFSALGKSDGVPFFSSVLLRD